MKYEYDYPMASLTADAVVFKCLPPDYLKQVLLIQRNTEPFKGCWALPGGFFDVETDEDLEEAAKRELFEEVGLKLDRMWQAKTYSKKGRDPRGRTVTVAFYGTIHGDEEFNIDEKEVQSVAWFDLLELPEMAFDHDVIIYETADLIS